MHPQLSRRERALTCFMGAIPWKIETTYAKVDCTRRIGQWGHGREGTEQRGVLVTGAWGPGQVVGVEAVNRGDSLRGRCQL